MALESIAVGDRVRIIKGLHQGKEGTVIAIDEQYDPPYQVQVDGIGALFYRYDKYSKYFEKVGGLPPTYQYYQEGKRIFVSCLKDGLRYPIPGYWLKEEKAHKAAWEHYRKLQEGAGNE